MKPIAPICLIIIGFLVSSCEHDIIPTADFETDFATEDSWLGSEKANLPTYATIEDRKFSDRSAQGVKVSWDFGNGQTSNEAAPVMHYESGGEYTVTLT